MRTKWLIQQAVPQQTFIGYYCVPDIRPGAKHTDSVPAYKGTLDPVIIHSYKTPTSHWACLQKSSNAFNDGGIFLKTTTKIKQDYQMTWQAIKKK